MRTLLLVVMNMFVGCADLDEDVLPTESASSALATCPTLSAPIPYGPSGNTSDHSPLYSWGAVSGATTYSIYVLDPAEVTIDKKLNTTNTWYQGIDLSDYLNVQLRWKVKGECHDATGYHAGPYSPSTYFVPYQNTSGGGGTCYPSLQACLAECAGVCERRINCGGANAHKCFE